MLEWDEIRAVVARAVTPTALELWGTRREEENDRHSGDKRRGDRALRYHGCLRNRRA